MKARTVFIYALVSPLTLKVHYVGQSTDPRRRLSTHLSARSLRADNRRNQWIRDLAARGTQPLLIFLQEVTDGHWAEAERAWIVQGRMIGWPLTNSSDGGEGVLSQEQPLIPNPRPKPRRRRPGPHKAAGGKSPAPPAAPKPAPKVAPPTPPPPRKGGLIPKRRRAHPEGTPPRK